MNRKIWIMVWIVSMVCAFSWVPDALAQSYDTSPPGNPVKLIFIHHSCGENWLSDGHGDLGRTLAENNYFVSDTNYGWGPDGIGDRTDIPDWLEWFSGPESARYLDALYNESEQMSSYTRTISNPGGENEIVMFKSCFPNSNLEGSPGDPPAGEAAYSVGGAKYVYNRVLSYFATRPDKLFVVITAPPVQDPEYAENARAFNAWLVQDWLEENDYPLPNVAVWDFHNILTHPDNHHRIDNGQLDYRIGNGDGTLYYDSEGDDHPRPEGNQKATREFVPMLNAFYHAWQASAPPPSPSEGSDVQPTAEEIIQAGPETLDLSGAETMINDFETPIDDWEVYWDEGSSTTFSCAVDQGTAFKGNGSLRMDYSLASGGWATCGTFFGSLEGLADTYGVAFHYRTAVPGVIFDLNLHGGTSDARSSYAHAVQAAEESVNNWVQVVVPWDQIRRVEWEENPGTPIDPGEVSGLSFGFGSGAEGLEGGTIWIDQLMIINQLPAPEEIAVEESPEEDPGETGSGGEEPGSRFPFCPGSTAVGLAGMVLWGGLTGARRKKQH